MPLLLAVAALIAACGSHQGPDAGAGTAQAPATAGLDGVGPVNANATIEAEPGLRLADSRAESAHVLALVRCDRLSAPARDACREEADADYQSVFTRAARLHSNPDPQLTK